MTAEEDSTTFWSVVFSPLVLHSGLVCLFIQCVLHGLFAYVLPAGPWKELPSFTAHQVVALSMMMFITVYGIHIWFFNEQQIQNSGSMEGRIFDIVESGNKLGSIVFGMLLFWDIPVGLLTPALHDTLMLLHHIGMLVVSGVTVGVFSNGHPIGTYYASFFFGVIELSSIFLSFVDMFHPKHKPYFEWLQKHTKNKSDVGNFLNPFNELCRVLFALSYLALRTLYFPYIMVSTCLVDFYQAAMLPTPEERHDATPGSLLTVCVLSLLFTFLQIYWGILVSKQVAKAVGILPSSSKNKKE